MEELQQIPWKLLIVTSELFFGGLFGIVLLLMKFPAARQLGKLLFSYLLLLVPILRPDQPQFLFWGLVSSILSLYLYSHTFFSQKSLLSYWHLVPFTTAIGLFWVNDIAFKSIVGVIFLIYFLMILHRLSTESDQRGISWFLNPGSRVGWFRNFVFLNIVGLAAIFFTVSWLAIPFVFLMLLMVIFQVVKESSFLAPIPIGNKYQKSTLTPHIKSAILSKIESIMDKEEFYLRDDASLSNLAMELGATTHHLSQVLNESMKMSFQDLIARYRIRHACRLLRDESNDQLKIENVAGMVGYNSKSAFNTAFKKRTGLTPSEYREDKDVRSYGEERLSERKVPPRGGSSFHLNHGFNFKMNSLMIQHFFKIFCRNVKRNGLFSVLNIFGLTVGFTCSILIYLFITDELSYDKDIPNYDRIYRIAWSSDNPQTRTPHPMAQAMVNDLPEVEAAVSISPWYGSGLSREDIRVKNVRSNIYFEEPDFFFTDSTFWKVFDLEFVEGDQEALSNPFSLVITERMAKKYFGDSSAIGQELELNDMPIAVSAVVKGMPKNSHFHFNAIISYVTLKQINPNDDWMTWADFGHFNYIKMKEGVDPEIVEAKIPDWVIGYLNWPQESIERLTSGEMGFILQPIASIHLRSHLRWELENNGNILYVYILTATLAFLILIACINYVNLTTAKSVERAKEIGVRKALGAVTRNLSFQFYMESILFCLIALVLSLGLAILFLDGFNYLSGKDFTIYSIFDAAFLTQAMGACITLGLIAGFYPAGVLTAFVPTEVPKGKLTTSGKGVRLRGALVIFQFAISAVLIAGSLIIFRQIDYIKNKELGFDKEAIISLSIPESVETGDINLTEIYSIRQQIESIPGVHSTSMISNLPGGQFNQHSAYVKGYPENRVDFAEVMVDFGVEELLGLEVIAGRSFDPSYATDTAELSFVINEIAVRQLELEQPVGKKLVWLGNDTTFEGSIVGVVRDFHYKSLHNDIQPLLMIARPDDVGHVLVKFDGNRFGKIIDQIEMYYEPLNKDLPFEYHFLDQQLAQLYDQEVRTLNIFSIFSAIALILASLGLLGMAIAILNQRIKEVGIRKILGASSGQIMRMILGQFVKLVGVALVIGLPIAYILMQQWLQEFSYQVPFGIMPFIWAILILLIVALVSVISAVAKITFANPVDTLRYE